MSMSASMTKYGITNWMAALVSDATHHIPGGETEQTLVLTTVYFLSMYLMSSITAHAAAIGPVLLSLPFVKESPSPMLNLVMHFTTLCAVSTNYSSGATLYFYKMGYISLGKWFLYAFVRVIIFVVVFFLVGPLWWG